MAVVVKILPIQEVQLDSVKTPPLCSKMPIQCQSMIRLKWISLVRNISIIFIAPMDKFTNGGGGDITR